MSRDPWRAVYEIFPAGEIPFLERSKRRLRESRPFRGLRILHNLPLTLEALHKIHALVLGGGEVTVCSPVFMGSRREAVEWLRQAGVALNLDGDLPAQVDVVLDCAGELLERVEPRVGAVELTRTGTQRYASRSDLTYPVISVDDSRVKTLQALLGTGDGFLRAFEALSGARLVNRSVVVFGFGRAGQGIVHALQPLTDGITVVEPDPARRRLVEARGLAALAPADRAAVEARVREAFAVVTATGRKNAIAGRYAADAFRAAHYLANMGHEDEFGPAFAESEVLGGKRPINHAIDRPTEIRYLDPVFYAHNLGIELLLLGELTPGLHPFPAFLAEEIVASWQLYFQEGLEERV